MKFVMGVLAVLVILIVVGGVSIYLKNKKAKKLTFDPHRELAIRIWDSIEKDLKKLLRCMKEDNDSPSID